MIKMTNDKCPMSNDLRENLAFAYLAFSIEA